MHHVFCRRNGLLLPCLAAMALLVAARNPANSAEPAAKRVLIVTGMDYPGHLWRQTSPVLSEAVRQDSRLDVYTVEDPHFLDSSALSRYDALVIHWQNWEQAAPGEAARENVRRFVEAGKGIAVVHFGCGAWHGEWPEFSNVVGRVWFGTGPDKRQHDPYGPFRVEIANPDHPIVRGMSAFETTDELYTCLMGDHPIEVLVQAKSKVDGKDYPLAFVSHYGQGRAFPLPARP